MTNEVHCMSDPVPSKHYNSQVIAYCEWLTTAIIQCGALEKNTVIEHISHKWMFQQEMDEWVCRATAGLEPLEDAA